MCGANPLEPGPYGRLHRHGTRRSRVDVQVHLFTAGDESAITAPVQPMKHTQTLLIDAEDLGGHQKGLAHLDLRNMSHVAFDRVEHALRGTVRGIDADAPVEHVHRVPEHP